MVSRLQGRDRKTEQVEGRAGVLLLTGLDLRQLVGIIDVLRHALEVADGIGAIGARDQAQDQVGKDDNQRHARDHREMATIELEGLVEQFA